MSLPDHLIEPEDDCEAEHGVDCWCKACRQEAAIDRADRLHDELKDQQLMEGR